MSSDVVRELEDRYFFWSGTCGDIDISLIFVHFILKLNMLGSPSPTPGWRHAMKINVMLCLSHNGEGVCDAILTQMASVVCVATFFALLRLRLLVL